MSEKHSAGEEVLLADAKPPSGESSDDLEHLAMEHFPTHSDDFKLADVEEVPPFPSTNNPEMQSYVEPGVADSRRLHSPPSIAALPESPMAAADDPAFTPDSPPDPAGIICLPQHQLVPTMHSNGSDDPRQGWDEPSPLKRARHSSDDVELGTDQPSLETTATAHEPADSPRVASVPTTIEPTASTSSAVRTLRVSGLLPKGLENLENSCYLNSVLQCLSYLPPFSIHCTKRRHTRTCSVGIEKGCFLCIMEDRVGTNLCEKSSVGRPGRLHYLVVRLSNGQFVRNKQEDAHELLGFLINRSTEVYKRRYPNSRFNTSFLERLLTGKTRTSTTCSQCGEVSTRDEPTWFHSLSISGVDSLADAFAKEFCTKELLEGDNKYWCERCNEYVDAERQTLIHEQPQVLSIQLKRFDERLQKISDHVEFPEQFSLADYMEPTANPGSEYKLCGVVIHDGSHLLNGHYIAYVKETNGKWYWCNDTKVIEVTKEWVLKEDAYMFFYNLEE